MTIDEAKKLLPAELKYPLPDGVIDNLINVQAIPLQFDFSDEDGNGNGNKGMDYAMMAALIELKERRDGGSYNSNARKDFMDIVYGAIIIQQWLNHLDDVKCKKQSQKNKMEQLAKLFGRKLGEHFCVSYCNTRFLLKFTSDGLWVFDDSWGHWNGEDGMLEALLRGEAVIVDD